MIRFHTVAACLALATAPMLGSCTPNPAAKGGAQASSRLPAILARGTIRCSYLIYPPYLQKDPNTGQLSGVFHDLVEEVAKSADLKVEWREEVGYESIFPSVNSGRNDMFCGGLWPNASRVRTGSFSIPVFYSVVKTWGRANETRFSGLQGIDDPAVRIAAIDGAQEDLIAQSDYPRATRVSLPQLSPFTQNFLNITSGKADITFAEPGVALTYLKGNPGSIKELAPELPVRTFGNVLVLPKGDYQLKEFVDVALTELLYSGRVDRILQKYEPAPGVFPRAALPYRPDTAILQAPSR